MKNLRSVTATLGLIATFACGGEFVCTLVGCVNGVRIKFDRVPDPGTVVQLEFPGASPWRLECDVACDGGVFFPDLRADRVRVRIITPTSEAFYEIRPDYVESRPNGPRCEPTCFNATVEVALP